MYSPRSTEEEDFDTCLALGLGVGRAPGRAHGERRPPVQFDVLFSPEQSAVSKKGVKSGRRRRKADDEDGGGGSGGRRSPSDDGGKRKKLRLTKEQTALLEDSFHAHNILSHDQKHELARQLRLSARQVEVWFQNRRARTKLKQTEVDCEFLKRCSESLRDENRRLKQELMDLRRSAARPAVARSRFYVQPPRAAAMVNVCPSCDRVSVMSGGETGMGSSYCM